jgi:hypothetical protein
MRIRMSVALAPGLWEEVRAAADRAGKSPDDWFADAAEAKLRAEEDAAAIEEAAREPSGRPPDAGRSGREQGRGGSLLTEASSATRLHRP